jgi:hypothetical protein
VSDPLTFASMMIEEQFYGDQINPLVRRIVLASAEWAMQTHGWLFHVTSAIRTKSEDDALGGTGIHVAGRAVDVRTRSVPDGIVKALAEWVNGLWIYDPSRPDLKVCYTEPHGTGPHAHFQVHQNTRSRNGGGASTLRASQAT